MCGGPTDAETSQQHDLAGFDKMLEGNYSTLFNEQADVLSQLSNSLKPIIAAGPNAHGMSGEELNARQAQAIATSGAAAAQAEQAARVFSAGRGGGGTSGVMSGIDQQIQAGIASQGAQAEASRLNQITSEDFALGRDNYWRAQGGMNAIAGQLSPNAAMSGSLSGGEAAFGEAKTMADQSNQMWKDITSFATAGIGAAADIATGGGASLFGAFKGRPGSSNSPGSGGGGNGDFGGET